MDPNSWSAKWRSAAAYVYLLICLCDFVVMPMYYEYMNNRVSSTQYVELALKFKDSSGQIEALKSLRMARVWEPLTLQSTGLFHVAFGAILGVVAWKGKEHVLPERDDSDDVTPPKKPSK